MKRIDLQEPQFTQAEVLKILPRLSGKTLQNWKARGILDAEGDTPGRGNRRLYTPLGIVMLNFMDKLTSLGIQPTTARKSAEKVAVCAQELWDLEIDFPRPDGMREIPAYGSGNDTYRRGFLYTYEFSSFFNISRNDPIGSISPRIYIVVSVDLINIAVLNLINRHVAGLPSVEVHVESTFDDEGAAADALRELVLTKIRSLPANTSY